MSLEIPASSSPDTVQWTLHARFPSGQTQAQAHNDIVRCVHWDETTQRLFSGGEDGRLLAWSLDTSEAPEAPPPSATPSSLHGGRTKRAGLDVGKRRYSPYA